MIVDKRNALDTVVVGDRINWSDGCREVWGTVVDVKHEYHEAMNGPAFKAAVFTIHCRHYPTYDSWGWPKDEERTVTRRFRKFYGDGLYRVYTPKVDLAAAA